MPFTKRIWCTIWMAVTVVGRFLQTAEGFDVTTKVRPAQLVGNLAVENKKNDPRGLYALSMVPRYNPLTKRWEPSTPEEDASAGYPPIGSLLRQGPIPFVQRLLDPDQYDQAVLKLMATTTSMLSRNEAQGNMDAYLQNPNDWALQKFEEQKGAPTFDYATANMDTTSLVLTAAWTSVLLTLMGRIVYVNIMGCDEFCRQYHW